MNIEYVLLIVVLAGLAIVTLTAIAVWWMDRRAHHIELDMGGPLSYKAFLERSTQDKAEKTLCEKVHC